METEFTYVQIPEEMAEIIGKRDGDAHVYTKEGTEEEVASWLDTLMEVAGPMVSPGGVAIYCPVSRAAVNKRIREGRLSCFTFFVKERKIGFFGKLREFRDTPYAFVPVSECKAWRAELEEKALRNERVTAEELEDARPEWAGEFLEWDSAWRKAQRKAGGPRNVEVTLKLSAREIECLDRLTEAFKPEVKTREELLASWVAFTTAEGMSGFSFVRLGYRVMRKLEEFAKRQPRPQS